MNTIHAGHAAPNKKLHGAVGIIDESERARQVVSKFLDIQKAEYEETFRDVTRDDLDYSLVNLCDRMNKYACDRDEINLSIHFNSFPKASANGTEVIAYSLGDSRNNAIASMLCESVSNALGTKNRGAKANNELAVLNRTKARSFIIECCFCTNQDDCNKYIQNGNEKIARAIIGVLDSLGYMERKKDVPTNTGGMYAIQLGAFSNRENAEKMLERVKSDGYNAFIAEI